MGRNPQAAGVNGTSPEIPNTVDADPYATAGKAAAVARQGESERASTRASAVKRDVAALVALRASVASVLSLCVRRESVDSLMPRRQEMRNADCGMRNVV